MITIERIFVEVNNLDPDDLRRWIEARLVRPDGEPGAYRFAEMDVARIRLILELRDVFEVGEPVLPTVLSLIDQIYDLRRRMRQLNQAMEHILPAESRAALLRHLEG
jgi:chaperone modulatory protein CbpM